METPPPPPSQPTNDPPSPRSVSADATLPEPPLPELGQSPHSADILDSDLAVHAEELALAERVQSSANWFYWIVGLSVINSLLHAFGVGFGFAVGLNATQVIDALFSEAKGAGRFLALLIDLVPLGFYAGLGFLASRYRAAFVVGMVCYLIDAVPSVIFRDWIGLAMHAWVLFSFFTGFRAAGELARLRSANAPARVAPAFPPPAQL